MPTHPAESEAVSKLSDRLAQAKRDLGLSTRQMQERAETGGYKLSSYSATVYTNGKHPVTPDLATLKALAYTLRIPLGELHELAGIPADLGEFEISESANLLTHQQRYVVNEIIRLFAAGNERAGDGDARDTTPMTDDGLGTFGGRARGDLDHENINDGSGSNITHLPPPPAGQAAAYRAHNRGKHIDDAYQTLGEETQDTEDNE